MKIPKTFLIAVIIFSSCLIISAQTQTEKTNDIEMKLFNLKDNDYILISQKLKCLMISLSFPQIKDIARSEWIIKRDLKENRGYAIVKLTSLGDWSFEEGPHYGNLYSPCGEFGKTPVSFLSLKGTEYSVIIPNIVENSNGYRVNKGPDGAPISSIEFIIEGDQRYPVWIRFNDGTVKQEIYYFLEFERSPGHRVFLFPEKLGDINPRPIWVYVH